LFEEKQADNIIGVCEADHSPLWMNTIPKDLSLNHFIREDIQNKNRQELETFFRINGAIYIRKVSSVLKEESAYKNSFAFTMPRERSVDIDTELDFIIAEALMNNRNRK
jgi:CMP-N-acetylneuraminic acid synthetase